MSYIDTFDNEFVGVFGGIWVYHPLEVVPALPEGHPRDFACGPENLVIGGGSGEHLGIVLKSPGEAVVCFVRAWLHQLGDVRFHRFSDAQLQALQAAIDAWPDALDRGQTPGDWRHIFEFAGWSAADHLTFSIDCTSQAFSRPFDPGKDASLEEWLAASLGEFIVLAMPELAQDAIERLGDLRRYIRGDAYQNILLLPPGYQTWGRREVDGHVVWGLSAWRISREHTPLTIRCR